MLGVFLLTEVYIKITQAAMAYHPDGNHHPLLMETFCVEAVPELLGYEILIIGLLSRRLRSKRVA